MRGSRRESPTIVHSEALSPRILAERTDIIEVKEELDFNLERINGIWG